MSDGLRDNPDSPAPADRGNPAGQTDALTVTEEVLLLILDTEKGDIQSSLPAHYRDIVIAGAALVDLALANRTDSDPERLFVVDPKPLGDELLDPILADIVGGGERDVGFWLERIAGRGDEIRREATDRLVKRGILEAEVNGLVFLSRLVARTRRYPIRSEKATEEVQARIMRVIFTGEIPDPRDIVIISLAAACGVFESILSREELSDVRDRIDQIAKLDLIGREVAAAVGRIEPRAPVETPARSHEEIPQARGWPIAGNAFDLAGDLAGFFAREYRKHGSIFRIRAFHRRFIAFAGPEAVVFLTKIGNTHLRSYEFWRDFMFASGSMRLIIGMDGPEHLRMRKLQAKAYTPRFVEERLDDFVGATRRMVAEWPQDRPMAGQRAMQAIIAEQMGRTLTSMSPQGYVDDLVVFLETLLNVNASRRWPKLAEYRPRFRRARKRVNQMYAELIDSHRPEKRSGKPRDFIDDVLEMNREDPQFLPETDYLMSFLGPYFVGLDTAATVCSFMLYTLLKYPDLLAKMRVEVDAAFKDGTPAVQDIRGLDVTRRIVFETLRKYPLFPVVTRIVSNSFEYSGYRIPAGTQILVGTTVGHRLPECYPDPERFDIERFTRDARKKQQPGSFAPFGLGRHRCLGSGFAEVQIMLTLATIVHEVDLAPDRPGRPLKIAHAPGAHPDDSFRFRVTGKRRRAA